MAFNNMKFASNKRGKYFNFVKKAIRGTISGMQ